MMTTVWSKVYEAYNLSADKNLTTYLRKALQINNNVKVDNPVARLSQANYDGFLCVSRCN